MSVATYSRKRWNAMARREAIVGYAFVLPWLLSLLIFTVYPVVGSFYFSLTEYNVVQPARWLGLGNYEFMFSVDRSFPVAAWNSAYYALISVPLRLIFSLGMAIILNMSVRGVSLYRTLYYLPSLTPPVASALIFMLLFTPGSGAVNTILGYLGIEGPRWFFDRYWAKPTLIILSMWSLGSPAIIFLAGLKEIPRSLLDAAKIDGASAWRCFWSVVLPLLSPVILFNLIMGIIYSFQVFTQAFIIGGTTGDPLESTLFYMILIYRNAFQFFKMGYASAQAVVLFLVIMLVSVLTMWSSGRWVYYEGTVRK